MKNFTIRYLRSLKRIIAKMSKTPWLYSKHPQKDFTRKRKLDFKSIISFLLTVAGKSLSNELLQFFYSSSDFPTSSAFVQQRNKLSPTTFERLFHSFSDSNIPNSTFRGYRLLAVDGTSLYLPPNPNEADCYFPSVNGKKHFNLLHINAMYDLINHTYVDAIVQGGQVFNERTAFNEMVDRSDFTKAIVTADRGYEAFNVLAHCIVKGWKFLIRVKDRTSGAIIKNIPLPELAEFDTTVSLVLGRSQTKQAFSIENYKPLASNTTFDFLPDSPKDSKEIHTFSMNFRVVRFRVSGNCFDTVITNLDPDDFPADAIKRLYAARWGIETSFRHLKKNIGLEFVHSKKVESIFHEIFARLTVYNFTALIAFQKSMSEKVSLYQYKPSFSNAILICRQLFLGKISPHEADERISRCRIPMRPHRSSSRAPCRKHAVNLQYRLA